MPNRLLVGDYKRNKQDILLDLASTYTNTWFIYGTSTLILKSIM